MSDQPEWGMCAAFGCPRYGSLSMETQGAASWYCATHFGGRPGDNDAKTRKLRSSNVLPLVNQSNNLRRQGNGGFDLAQVESEIDELCRGISADMAPRTAGIDGPSHIGGFLPYNDE